MKRPERPAAGRGAARQRSIAEMVQTYTASAMRQVDSAKHMPEIVRFPAPTTDIEIAALAEVTDYLRRRLPNVRVIVEPAGEAEEAPAS
jgi:hypothetical protein